MAGPNRDVDRRAVDEAAAITEQAMLAGERGEEAMAATRHAIGEAEARGDVEENPVSREEHDALSKRLEEALIMVQGLTATQAGAAATEDMRRKAHGLRIANLIARGGQATVIIHPSPSENENWPVPLGINGATIKVPRGVPTRVPVAYLAVLEDACIKRIEPIVTPGGDVVMTQVNRPSYPYSVMELHQ
jgi:hypothetical protein